MSRKPIIYSYPFFDGALSTTTTSDSTDVSMLDQASIDLSWSGSTLSATVTVEVQNGKNAEWRTLDFGSAITISGTSGSHEIIFLAMPFISLRLVCTVTSGAGDVQAVLTAKALGA